MVHKKATPARIEAKEVQPTRREVEYCFKQGKIVSTRIIFTPLTA